MSTASEGVDLTPLLGLAPNSKEISSLLSSLSPSSSSPRDPSIASYPDIVYLSYHSLGLSLSFEPTISSYKPKYRLTSINQLECDKLYCVGIDVYNHEEQEDGDNKDVKDKKSTSTNEYEPFPRYPILLPSPSSSSSSKSTPFPLTPTTTGKELVEVYGEPLRKGGGDTKGMGIWTEWTKEGIMIEWKSTGLGAWDKGGESQWRVLSLFEPGVGKGKEDDEE
ncbi:uncharacterized protein JCM6883_003054 [Sporobolomyces salmoneus]|uniref:uncharacterized protein n=1 Tax=Sporobolomyces salmoneus TaxID=183962 RepID=UPI0031791B72